MCEKKIEKDVKKILKILKLAEVDRQGKSSLPYLSRQGIFQMKN